MNRELFIEKIKEECDFLEGDGYNINLIENNISFVKINKNEGFSVGFSWVEYGDNFYIQGITAKKRFNIVEREIQQVMGGNIEDYYTINRKLSADFVPNELNYSIVENNIRIKICDEHDVFLFSELLHHFYLHSALGFFKTFQSIEATFNYYTGLKREDISTFIVNNGTDIFYRELVLMNKSGADDEIKFVQMVRTELEPLMGNVTFKNILNNFNLIYNNLIHPKDL